MASGTSHRHITSAPYHPASNGLAKQAVQIVKKGLKKESKGSRLANVLLLYCIMPTGITCGIVTGSETMYKVKPHTAERVSKKHDTTAKTRVFKTGTDLVWAKKYTADQP